jgi:2-oxo-4-hydroxy-4-carboxy-5-ureidoimidazoline decarboxylase
MAPAAIAAVDAMGRDAFTDALRTVVEHSPWVAERVWELRPFGSPETLHLAFETAIRTAPPERRMEVLRAHPELADREAQAGRLTLLSAAEQQTARLDQLSTEELDALQELNAGYRERFGFPFISCVREHSVASLLAWGLVRLNRNQEDEAATALAEVGKIIGLRLRERVAG